LLSLSVFFDITIIDVLDILVVGVLIYLLFRWIKGSAAMNIFIAIIIIVLLRVVSKAIGMKMLTTIVGAVLDVGIIAIIVIFQPEIRRFLNSLGNRAGRAGKLTSFINRVFGRQTGSVDSESLNAITQACDEMAEQKVGALIVIRHKDGIEEIAQTGDRIDAQISSNLIQNIFFKNSPLHDGAMIIDNNRILAARCTLPITDRSDIPSRYGMRHKAAIGLSERCDADVIVVSEQTGKMSIIRGGEIKLSTSSKNAFKLLLTEMEAEQQEPKDKQ